MPSTETTIDCTRIAQIEQSYGFRMMVFPRYKSLLNFSHANQQTCVIKASIEEEPAGLAVSVLNSAPSADNQPSVALDIVSLFVQPQHRHKGVAEQLLITLENESQTHRRYALNATYMTGQNTTAYLEKLFSKRGFTPPVTRMLAIRCSLNSIKHIPWLSQYALPHGYAIKRWVDLKHEERLEIKQSNTTEPWIAADLNPFNYEQGIDPTTSVVLLAHGNVRGWCLNHIINNRLRFTCSFVHLNLQRAGMLTFLISYIAKVMPQIGLNEAMWTVPIALHPRTAQFMTEHIKPYATFFAETKQVSKIIS